MNAIVESPVKEFRENGYVILPAGLSTKEVDYFFSQASQILDVSLPADIRTGPEYATADEKYLWLKENRPALKSHVYDLLAHLDSLWKIAASPTIVETVKNIVQTPVLIDQPQIRIDDDSNDRLLPLHQEGFGQMSYRCISAWIPLVDVDETNGGLRWIPGSHKNGYVPHRFFPEFGNAHGVVDEYTEGAEVKALTLNRGDVFLFDPCLMHGSTPNQTPNLRWTCVIRYNSLDEVPYLTEPEAPMRIEQVEAK